MIRLIAVILCFALLISFVTIGFADGVDGLREKMDELRMKNNFTQEEIVEMDNQYVAYQTKMFFYGELPFIKESQRYKTESRTDEDELEYHLNLRKANYDSAILAVRMNTYRYANQYIESGNFRYLFSNEEYWAAPVPFFEKLYNSTISPEPIARFTKNGEFLPNFNDFSSVYLFIPANSWRFLQNDEQIEQLLLEKGETVVSEIKLFGLSTYMSFMYIRCDSREYMVKLHTGSYSGGESMREIELLKLYTIQEIMNAFVDVYEKGIQYTGSDIGASMLETKPMYTTECESLIADGLIYGNENGLDPLKPLTRIEAAAMLLRVLGEAETAPDNNIQTFADVPSNHWGYGAAERAYSEGLIQGVGDNQFAPDKTVAATEFATMLLRAAETGEFDWEQALNKLIQEGLITSGDAQTMDLFTRGDMAKIIYEAREKGLL